MISASDALGVLIAALVLALPSVARGEPDEATKAAARQLAQDGARAMEEKRYADAQDLLNRAYELVPAPTIAVLEARALDALGRLVEAAEHYELARRTELDPDASGAFVNARSEAERELQAIRQRIPQLTIEVRGVDRRDVRLSVTLDGVRVPPELIGVRRPVDPGEHQLTASVEGGSSTTRKLTLAERKHERVLLTLSAPPPSSATADVTADSDPGSTQRTWGYIGLGLGTAGLATGVVAGLIMLDKKSSLDDQCGATCPPAAESDLDTFRSARLISIIGYGVGAAALGVGTVLLLTAPSAEDGVALTPGPGDLGIALSGVFR